MAAHKLPRQISSIKKGMRLKFLRQVQDGNVYLNKASGPSAREVDILEDGSEDGLVLVAFKTRIRNIFGQPVDMFNVDGFKYTRWVRADLLLDNCKEIK
jgi:hypothetical protein